MAMAAFDYSTPFGGTPSGRYRTALTQTSSSAAQQASAANLGAYANPYQSLAQYRPEPIAVESAGIRTGEIVGFRAWSVDGDGFLRSVAMTEYVWRPGEIEHAPKIAVGFGEGIHAFKTLQKAKDEYSFVPNVVFGEVDLWGEVIEFERGWKAEYAAVKNLICFAGPGLSIWKAWWGEDSRLKKLRERYCPA